MRDTLDRLFTKAAPPRSFGIIENALLDGRYTVIDSQGRKYTVDGQAGYPAGLPVIHQAGRIIARGSRPEIKTIKV